MNIKYYNYEDLGITSARKPENTGLFIETDISGTIYIVDLVSQDKIYKTINKGSSWSLINDGNDHFPQGIWHDRDNEILRVVSSYPPTGKRLQYKTIDLSDDTVTTVSTTDMAGSNYIAVFDVFMVGVKVYALCRYLNGTTAVDSIYIYDITNDPAVLVDDLVYDNIAVTPSWVVVIGTDVYFYFFKTGNNIHLFKFDENAGIISHIKDCGANTDSPVQALRTIAYDGSDTLYFILKFSGTNYLYTYSISTDTLTKLSGYNVALQLDRNTGVTEKAFHLTLDKVYQIPTSYSGRLNLISKFNFSDTIIAITDHFVIDNSGKVYEYVDLIAYILEGLLYHSRNDYPTLKLKFNSDNIQINPQQFIQIIGSYTVDGSTTSNKVIFEGIAEAPTEGRIQYVEIVNQGYEMDETKPDGSKAGRSDQIISDINDDGAPHGPEYIRDGTLAVGSVMGTLEFNNTKTYRKVVNDFAEKDGFLFNLRPQGDLDYNNGSIDSGADIRQDGTTYFDVILQVKAWKIAKLNQIIVNGAMNLGTGKPYSGIWNDTEDQQEVGINSATIEDANLNSDALCQAKADTIGANETERLRARFKFRKTIYGLIQPGQTITFKYVIANYITIAEAQFILDKIILNVKTGVGYAEISSGL